MTPSVAHVVVALIGVGLVVGGCLMLIRPELFRGIPPDEDLTPRGTRIGGVMAILFGLCTLWLVFGYGLKPCAPDECTGF